MTGTLGAIDENLGGGFAPTTTLNGSATLTSTVLAGDFDGDGDA